MHKLGFVKVGCGRFEIKVADIEHNYNESIKLITEASNQNIEVLLFPELSLTGYTCGDLFLQSKLLNECENYILKLCDETKDKNMLIIIGSPLKINNALYNCAVAINNGKILGVIPKTYLPNYNEFYEKRWFSSSLNNVCNTIEIGNIEVPFGTDILFHHRNFKDLTVGIEICEDLWVTIPPSSYHCLSGATLILNPSASNELVGKSSYRKSLVQQQSARCLTGYAYASSGSGESTTDVVYSGHCMIYENGVLLSENQRFKSNSQLIYSEIDIERIIHDRIKSKSFSDFFLIKKSEIQSYRKIYFETNNATFKLSRKINPHPFVPSNKYVRDERCEDIFHIQTSGLAKRIKHVGNEKVIVGISGGLDSTLALLVCVKTYDQLNMDRKNILGITMPGFGTTDRTYTNAINLMKNLGITIKEISIKEACIQHFKDIDHNIDVHDLTYENTQARERTQLLMDLATKEKGFVIGTGDLSELALGWATYNGDHMSMYAVNTSIPKTLVRYLVQWIADNEINDNAKETLLDILDTPVSPELIPPDKEGNIKQKTEELVGPYELHDFFLYHLMRFGLSPKKIYFLAQNAFKGLYDCSTIYKWLKAFYWRFFSQQFKRSCLPDGPKVGSICLSPRGDWRMPSDASVALWMKELNELD